MNKMVFFTSNTKHIKYFCNLMPYTKRTFSNRRSEQKQDTQKISAEVFLAKPNEKQHEESLQADIKIEGGDDVSAISGIPKEHIRQRLVRIFEPAKNCMQSGTDNLDHWRMEFETRERWENPLMGWSANGDPMSNINLKFGSKEEAIVHCERNGWKWYVQESSTERAFKPKSYLDIFSWNKRTRASTK